MRVNSLWLRRRTGAGNVNLWSPDVGTPLVISALPSTWTRYEVANASASTTRTLLLELTVTGDEVDIWEGQLELGRSATPNIPTTSAPVTTTDWPRTNYIAKSNKFSSAVWGLAQAGTGVLPTIVSEAVPSPTGSLDATRITFDQGTGDTLGDSSQLDYYQAASLTTGAPYCAGIWARIPMGSTIAVRSVGASGYMAMVGTGQWKRYPRPENAGSAFAYRPSGLRGGLGGRLLGLRRDLDREDLAGRHRLIPAQHDHLGEDILEQLGLALVLHRRPHEDAVQQPAGTLHPDQVRPGCPQPGGGCAQSQRLLYGGLRGP